MLREPPARASDDAYRMRLVDHREGVVATRHLEEARQVEQVAVHREDAVRDDKSAAVSATGGELAAEVVHVAVAVDEHVRAREPAAIDDRGVVQFVGKHGVALPDERGDCADVRHIARAVDERRLRPLERRKRALEPHMWRLRAGRETCAARPCAELVRGVRRRLDDARIARKIEIVVGRKDDELASVHDCRRTGRTLQRPAPARKPRRLPRVERVLQSVEAPRRICRGRERWDVLNEDGRALQELDRLRHALARTAIEEDASAVRVALLLEDGDAPVAELARRDIARYVVRVVRHADLGDDARRVLHLRREDDRLGVVVLDARRPLRQRRGVVHVGRPDAARAVGLEPLERVRVEQHRAAERMRLREPRHDLVRADDPRLGQQPRHKRTPLGGSLDGMRPDRQRLEADEVRRLRLHLDVDEVRRALRMRQRPLDEPRRDL